MLKHSYHARLSVWHVVLMVIILGISLQVIAKPVTSPATLLKQSSLESQSEPQTSWQMPQSSRSVAIHTIDSLFP